MTLLSLMTMRAKLMAIKHESEYDGIPVVLREYGTPEWSAMNWCTSCDDHVSGAVYQQEDNSNKYCEHCWDVVQDLVLDHF
jgi:hypothetical protein